MNVSFGLEQLIRVRFEAISPSHSNNLLGILRQCRYLELGLKNRPIAPSHHLPGMGCNLAVIEANASQPVYIALASDCSTHCWKVSTETLRDYDGF